MKRKWALGVLGALAIGALGSGIWDIGLKPGFQFLGRGILTAATLGSSAIKDSIYREAAKGHHEASAMFIFSFFEGMLFWLPWLTLIVTIKMRKRIIKLTQMRNIRDKAVPGDAGRSRAPVKIAPTTTLPAINRFASSLYILYVLTGALWVAIGAEFVSALKITQANTAYTFFAQAITICQPYMDDKAAQMLKSRFASINTKTDYLAVISCY
jgi:hypothetical protein